MPAQIEFIKKRIDGSDESSAVRIITAGGFERWDMRPEKTVQFKHAQFPVIFGKD